MIELLYAIVTTGIIVVVPVGVVLLILTLGGMLK
jgi:hypothetical protein